MARQLTWLSDAEWAKIEPLLPQGRSGARRVDDRRVIAGIMHMLKSGARFSGSIGSKSFRARLLPRSHRPGSNLPSKKQP
ncbi:MAG: transposase [Sphingomonas sp.]|nr:transposase [Sphingomonas sp.]